MSSVSCVALAQGLVGGEDAYLSGERLRPDVYPAPASEPYDPFFDIDYSLSLRGSYSKGTSGERFDVELTPSVSAEHIGSRSAIQAEASADLVRAHGTDTVEIGGLRLGLQAGYQLDRDTRLTARGELNFDQPLAGMPGTATNVATPGNSVVGSAEVGVTREFGKFNAGVTAGVARQVYGATALVDGTRVDNFTQNHTAYSGTLRVGYDVTPIFEVFGETRVKRDQFDNDLPAILARADATDMRVRAGIVGRWDERLEASASIGTGVRKPDHAGLSEVQTQFYDAEVTYRPDETLRMTAGYSTNLVPASSANAPSSVRLEQKLRAEVGYTVNSWLALRGLADWTRSEFAGTNDFENAHGIGAGADYKVNAHTAVSADYEYDYVDSTQTGKQEAHRVSVGLTVSR
jgi:hypothetical protein